MTHSPGEKLFFLDNDREVNRLVFKICGVFLAVLFGLLTVSALDIFKVSPVDVIYIIVLLLSMGLIFFILLKINAPVATVKYYGLLSMEFCLAMMIANAYFGIYITNIIVPVISCLYFDRRLTRNITIFCYIGMMIALWFRAPGAILLAYPGYTRVGWFIAFGLGYTLEYIAVSAVLIAVSKRSRIYLEKLYHRNEQIGDIQNKIIYRFADLVESRDDNTGKHVKRTSRYVVMIANRLRRSGPYSELLNKEDVVNIELAAPLHDIGKIVIPDFVLLKPGRLTPEEFEIIKKHTTEGQKIISSAMEGIERDDFLEVARDIALSHHEKWDGSGYPAGLCGTEISLPARIMAVADVFDALVSNRCYKQAVSVEDAFAVLREGSGAHFDPVIVSTFLDAESEIRAIIAEQ